MGAFSCAGCLHTACADARRTGSLRPIERMACMDINMEGVSSVKIVNRDPITYTYLSYFFSRCDFFVLLALSA